jgi:hypothetical protein
MSFRLPSVSRSAQNGPSWSGLVVVVESMVLLMFLVASMAVLLQLFALGSSRARDGDLLARAVAESANAAELFAADPTSLDGAYDMGDLRLECITSRSGTETGTLYHVTIRAFDKQARADAGPIYTLVSKRYVRYESEVD